MKTTYKILKIYEFNNYIVFKKLENGSIYWKSIKFFKTYEEAENYIKKEGKKMKRYKRGYVIMPNTYKSIRVEMNLYKNEYKDVFISWEGGWQKVKYNKKIKVWEFDYE